MDDSRSNQSDVRQLAPGGRGIPSCVMTARPELTAEMQKYMHILGPTPKRCLETLADLGLSDVEIGRYFGIPYSLVMELRDIWKIDLNTRRM